VLQVSQLTPFTYIMVEVDPFDELGAPADPTALPCEMGFSRDQGPALTIPFFTGIWQVNTKAKPSKKYVMCPIGFNADVGPLWGGVWWPVVRIYATPEIPVLLGKPFRVIGELLPAVQTTYPQGTTDPDLWVEWLDGNGVLVPFASEPHTFSLVLWNRLTPLTLEFTKTTGFVVADSNPNLVVPWTPGAEIANLAVGVYDGQIIATRVSDGKVRRVPITIGITP